MKKGNSEAFNSRQFEIHSGDVPGLVIFRNNCGVLPDGRGGMVRFGVGNDCGGSDFIGWYQGRFCAFEIKADEDNTDPKRLRKQENFIAKVIESGGYGGFVRRPADIALILERKGCVRLADYPKERLK